MKEDFIQNIHFDLFSVELVIGETATLLLAESYVTIREVFVDGAKVEPNEEKQIFLQSGGDDLWELDEGDILQPKDSKTFTIKKASEVNAETGSVDKYLNEQGDMAQVEAGQVKYAPSSFVESENVQDAITELGNCKQVMLVSGANIKTINGESILGSGNIEIQGGGSTDITLKNENIGGSYTVIVDTAYDWHVVSKTLGGAGVFTFDFANGVLPTKNKEYLIILKNDSVGTLTVTMPTGSITVGGVVFNFNNSISTFPLNAGKTAEVNVIAVYLDSTTCNIRITTQSSI